MKDHVMKLFACDTSFAINSKLVRLRGSGLYEEDCPLLVFSRLNSCVDQQANCPLNFLHDYHISKLKCVQNSAPQRVASRCSKYDHKVITANSS